MEDYKNEQWWIELQKSLEGFDDSKMSDSDLGRWNGCKIGGLKGGGKNSKSGHMKKIQKENAHIGGTIMGPIIGKKYGIDNFKKTTFEHRSKGGKKSGKDRVLDGTLLKASKIGAMVSTKNRIDRGLENKKKIIDSINSDTFTTSEARKACEEFGYKSWKSLLKESKLVKQIYKGMNQFDPSIYQKVIN